MFIILKTKRKERERFCFSGNFFNTQQNSHLFIKMSCGKARAPQPTPRATREVSKDPKDGTHHNINKPLSDSGNRTTEEELLKAAFDGDFETVKRLLKEGVSTEVTSQKPGQEGLTPLHLACWSGQVMVVKLLIHYQAKKNVRGKGRKPVHYAALGGHVGVLSVLWDAECNIKSKASDGLSALHLAADNGNLETVKWLVEKGAYLHQKNKNGLTPEDLAKHSGYKEVAKYLREKNEELRMDGLTEKKKLGEGAFGDVYLVKRKGRYLVLKEINLSEMERKKQEYAHQEIKLLKSLTHPYIVAYLGGGFKGRHLYIQMEYCSGGDLYDRITEQKGKNVFFEEKQVVNWCLRVCLALKYIHGRNILHRDIKPHNIFLTGNGVIKLGDFGLSKALEEDSVASTHLGSPAYMSPELMRGNLYDSAADMWAFGCVMFEVATLKLAFPYNNLQIPSTFSRDYQDAVTSLLQQNPLLRPKADDLLRLNIFHDALEGQLEEKERQVSELNQEVEDLCTEIEDLSHDLQSRDNMIKKLTAK